MNIITVIVAIHISQNMDASEHSSVYFSKCSKLLIFEDRYSSDMYYKSVFTMFNLDGKMIGIFELHYNNFDCVFSKIK